MWHRQQWRGNGGVGRGSREDWEGDAPCGRVGSARLNKTDEIVGAILIVGNVQEEGIQDFAEGSEIIVRWLANNRLEGGGRHGEERGDLFRGHGDGREARDQAEVAGGRSG